MAYDYFGDNFAMLQFFFVPIFASSHKMVFHLQLSYYSQQIIEN